MKFIKKKVLPEFPGIAWAVDDLIPTDKIFVFDRGLIDDYLKELQKKKDKDSKPGNR